MNIDWKRKLTSRKWWISVAAFIAGLVVAFGFGDNTAATVTGCLMSLATAVAYTLGEGFIDAASVKANTEADKKEGQNDKQEH